MIEDAELLRRYSREKSEEAFAELVRRRIGLVYSVALRHTHDVHRAEDVTQKVFTALARKADALSQRPVLVGWLYRSAQFAASDAVRAERRRQVREQEAQTMQELTRDAHEPDWEKLHPGLDELLNDMDERDRDAVLLRFYDAQPFAEIGRKLQLTENAARMRVERALDKMQATLARRGVTSTAAALGVALANQVGATAPVGLAAAVTNTALAGAGSSAAGAIAFFMSTTKTVTIAACLVVVLAVSSAIYEVVEKQRSQRQSVVLKNERDALRGRITDLENRLSRAEQPAASARADGLGNTGGEFDSRRYEQERARRLKAEATAVARAQEHFVCTPEIQELAAQRLKASLPLHFGPLYSMLKLSPEKIAQFEAAMTRRFWAVADVRAAAVNRGVSFSDPATHEMEDQALAGLEGELQSALGEENYAKYRGFEATTFSQGLVETFAAKVYSTTTPLSASQATELEEIIAANATKPKLASESWIKAQVFFIDKPNGALSWTDVDWDAALNQAKAVLSAEQMPPLQALRDSFRLQEQFQQKSKQFTEDFRRQISESRNGTQAVP